jgi:hypothetical protein
MSRHLPVATAFGVLLASLVIHGLCTARWGQSPELAEAVARLNRIPMTLGDWGGDPLELASREQQKAGIAGYVLRRYTNRLTGTSVMLSLACGRPGPISVHTPEVCYQGIGYKPAGSPTRSSIRVPSLPRPADFWMNDFRKEDAADSAQLRIYWSWNGQAGWGVPDNPRLAFAGAPVLYKLYVVRVTAADEDVAEKDPSVEFIHLLLPHINAVLFEKHRSGSE